MEVVMKYCCIKKDQCEKKCISTTEKYWQNFYFGELFLLKSLKWTILIFYGISQYKCLSDFSMHLSFCLVIYNQNNFPSLLQQHLLSCMFTGMRAGQPVTHMRSTNSKPQPSNQVPKDKIKFFPTVVFKIKSNQSFFKLFLYSFKVKVANFVLESPTICLKGQKHFNFLIIYIETSALFSQCLKQFDKRFNLSKPLLSESLLCSDWSDGPVCWSTAYSACQKPSDY